MHDNSISYDPPSPPETAMLPVGPRLVGSRRCLQCFSQKLASSSSPSPLRAVIASSGVGRKSSRRFSSSDDRERQTAAALSRAAPTPTPPPLHQGKHNLAATEILINRSGLLPTRMQHGVDNRPPLKGLAKELEQMIMLNGPITVAEYMIYALQHPQHGYYMRQKDKIGLGGDFITAPEISQAFGEMIGIWCVASWKEKDCPEKCRLVELGPGKGTLMADILRTASSFPDFRKALTLHMVETSEDLKASQVKKLGATFAATASYSASRGGGGGGGAREVVGSAMQLPGGGQVMWHPKLDQVPKGDFTLVIAQEFLDALPVHQFVYTAKGWRERLIDINVPGDGSEGTVGEGGAGAGAGMGAEREKDGDGKIDEAEEADFRFVLSPEETTAVKAFLTKEDQKDAKLVMGGMRTSTPGGAGTGARGKGAGAKTGPNGEKVGDRLEVSGESILVVKEIAERVAEDGGGALFVDYGEGHALEDSLRCFKGHKEVPVLSSPGEADMTADVNFGLLRRVVGGVKGARPHGPVGQGQFLREMGIGARLTALAEQPSVSEEQGDAMLEGYVRLVDPAQMGTRYKVLGITEEQQELPPPGFMSEIDLDVRKE
eukprot:jgi/Undpi1/11515/HiC_scaffold_30.g13812.m1